MGDVCFVFPNRRAGLFFKQYLSKQITKPQWTPKTFSIEDFIDEITGFQVLDNVDMIFELYDIHKKIEKEHTQHFEEFIKWAPVMLADFNDVDEYLAEAESLYKELDETKALSVWNLNRRKLTDFEKNYIRFFNNMLIYYTRLNKKLLAEKKAYRGLAYRKAADLIMKDKYEHSFKRIVFAGFNALSTSEEKIISLLTASGQADTLWNADAYYFERIHHGQPVMEAGKFLYKYFKKNSFKNPLWIDNTFKDTQKEVEIVGVPDTLGQVKYAGSILAAQEVADSDFNNTAIILADESLLVPLLNSIPENVGSFNVTMGLAIHNTPPYQLFESLFTLNENARSFAELRKDVHIRYNLRDIIKILNHPYIGGYSESLFGINPGELNNIIRTEVLSGKVFYSFKDLSGIFSIKDDKGFFAYLFLPWKEKPIEIIDRFSEIIDHLKKVFIQTSVDDDIGGELEIEYLFHFAQVIEKLRALLRRFDFVDSIRALHDLLTRLIKSKTIPFYGEPLQGMQVMGMLETRTLDFENVVLLSANENVLPASKYVQSFIPYDIREKHDLPTHKDRDAVYAYHFYSLISRAKRVYITYDTRSDALKGSDKSRFISQIEHELRRYNPGIRINEKILNTELSGVVKQHAIKVEKNELVMKALTEKAGKGISASSLDVLRICSLRFYFKDILKLPEAEEIEEHIDAAMFGSVIHKVLEKLYKPLENQYIRPDVLKNKSKTLEAMVSDAFLDHNRSTDLNHGKNYLILKVASTVLQKFVRAEVSNLEELQKANASRKIIHSEKRFQRSIKISNDDVGDIDVKIHGIIDRIDAENEYIRIIDYKTGFINPVDLKIKEWDQLLGDYKFSKGFQLFVYAWLTENLIKDYQKTLLGIFSLRTPAQGLYLSEIKGDKNVSEQDLHSIGAIIKEMLGGLFNISAPFRQTENKETCKYCPYKLICNK